MYDFLSFQTHGTAGTSGFTFLNRGLKDPFHLSGNFHKLNFSQAYLAGTHVFKILLWH